MRGILTFCLIHFSSLLSHSQLIPINESEISRRYNFISSIHNRISNPSNLASFFHKLKLLKDCNDRTVSIVHIGDSHIQADFLSGVVRNNLQTHFGNAGRGLIFPYQLAQSNAPSDITSSSDTRWEFNRLAHPEIPINSGVSGFVLQTSSNKGSIGLNLRNQGNENPDFNKVTIFTDSASLANWSVGNGVLLEENVSNYSRTFQLRDNSNEVLLSSNSEGTRQFYGVSLQKSDTGILYHTIGVNGARFDHFNNSGLFWKQLGELKADLYIISLGTNEAQTATFNKNAFIQNVESFLQKLNDVSPNASIIITTAPDSYKKGRSNVVLRDLNRSLVAYCQSNRIPSWDLYTITNGYGSAYHWNKRRLMNRDRIHFTAQGYRLQGTLLLNAIAKGFNEYYKLKLDD